MPSDADAPPPRPRRRPAGDHLPPGRVRQGSCSTRPDDWHLTEDVEEVLARAGGFLRSHPALHTMALSVTEKLRTLAAAAVGAPDPVFGRLEQGGEVRAAFHRLPSRGLSVTPLTPGQADGLAAHLVGLGHAPPYVTTDHGTATAFAEALRRHTDATPAFRVGLRLLRLGTLTPPDPEPAGGARPVGAGEQEHLMRWCREFAADVGEAVTIDARSWASTRFAEKSYTFWETPDGTPVSMAGVNAIVGGRPGSTPSTPPPVCGAAATRAP